MPSFLKCFAVVCTVFFFSASDGFADTRRYTLEELQAMSRDELITTIIGLQHELDGSQFGTNVYIYCYQGSLRVTFEPLGGTGTFQLIPIGNSSYEGESCEIIGSGFPSGSRLIQRPVKIAYCGVYFAQYLLYAWINPNGTITPADSGSRYTGQHECAGIAAAYNRTAF